MSTYHYPERTYGRTHADVITKFSLIDGFSIGLDARRLRYFNFHSKSWVLFLACTIPTFAHSG